MVSLKRCFIWESVRTSGSTEAAVLYMGSGWDIHPEGNLKKETVGNKAKSFQRHQGLSSAPGQWSWAVAQAFLSTQSTIPPPSRSVPIIKGKKRGYN